MLSRFIHADFAIHEVCTYTWCIDYFKRQRSLSEPPRTQAASIKQNSNENSPCRIGFSHSAMLTSGGLIDSFDLATIRIPSLEHLKRQVDGSRYSIESSQSCVSFHQQTKVASRDIHATPVMGIEPVLAWRQQSQQARGMT